MYRVLKFLITYHDIKVLVNDIKYFKLCLKRFLYHHSFYSIEEYFEYNEDKDI